MSLTGRRKRSQLKLMFNKIAWHIWNVAEQLKRADRRMQGRAVPPLKREYERNPIKRYDTALGTYYLPKDAVDDIVVMEMIAGRIFDSEIVSAAKRYVRPGSIVLVVGANFGQMSLLFSKMVGVSGEVIAFEASDFIFHLLEQNIKANRAENVRAVFGAVWNVARQSVIYPEPDLSVLGSYGSFGIDPDAATGRKLMTVTVDELKIDKPISFMKVDIQGSDLFAMKGAEQTIRRHKMPIIFEFEEQLTGKFKTNFDDYCDFVRSISYRFEQVIITPPSAVNFLIVPRSTSVAMPGLQG